MTCFLELAIACLMNFGLSPEHIVRRHIPDGTVQAHSVAVIHVGFESNLPHLP